MVTFMPRHVKSSLQRLLICVQLLVAGSLWAQHTHAPQRPPRVQLASGAAFAPDGSLWLVGLNHAGQLFVQSAPGDDLRRWGSPRLIATGGDTVAADGESRPKIAFGDRGQHLVGGGVEHVECRRTRALFTPDPQSGGNRGQQPLDVVVSHGSMIYPMEGGVRIGSGE